MSKIQEKPSALQRKHPALQKMKFITFFSMFVGNFYPRGSGSRIRIRMQGPYSIRIQMQGPHLIRIQSGSGSTTLLPTVPDNRLDRAKDLLSGDLHVVLDLGKDGGLHVVALLPRPLAPHHKPRALLHPAPNVGQDGVHLSLGDLGLGYTDYDVF
jgi:hypothetical protein